ncbi:MAG: glycosyltransferase family 1 protein [Chloroflexi bacterium]|nr:glycosyltransferase family 1 protein [Chloroflexota bacterium]
MRVLLFGFGSRGDVQPFAALGKGLQRAGYDVTLAAGSNFESWVRSEGLNFDPIQVDVEAMMQTDIGKNWLDGSSHSPQAEVRNMKRMADAAAPGVAADILRMIDQYDAFISGALAVEAMAAATAARGKRHVIGLMSPWAPTRSGAAGMNAPLPRANSLINLGFGYFIESMMSGVLRAPSLAVRSRLNLPAPTRGDFMRAWNRTPALIGISPLVTPPPPDWNDCQAVTGYWFLDAPAGWQPSPALTAFLEAGEPPVYVGFGSMSSRDPEATLRIMLDALVKSGRRGVIHSGWAGLKSEKLPDNVFLLDSAPHDWLFPRMAAVIHHGGAGTTAAGLRAGVPSAIVAHIGDQPYWGRRLHELGVGAPLLRRHLLTADNLVETIRLLTTDRDLRARAAALGERIRAEDGVGNAVRAFEQFMEQEE